MSVQKSRQFSAYFLAISTLKDDRIFSQFYLNRIQNMHFRGREIKRKPGLEEINNGEWMMKKGGHVRISLEANEDDKSNKTIAKRKRKMNLPRIFNAHAWTQTSEVFLLTWKKFPRQSILGAQAIIPSILEGTLRRSSSPHLASLHTDNTHQFCIISKNSYQNIIITCKCSYNIPKSN